MPDSLVISLLKEVKTWHVVCATSGFIIYRILYQLYIYPTFLSPLRKAPGPPRGHWLFGQSPNVIQAEPGILHREWLKKYGDRRGILSVIGAFGVENVMFMSSEAMHKVLVSDWLDYPRPDFMRNLLGIVAGYGLLTVTGNVHKQMRKFMNPAFSISNLMAQTDMYYKPIYKLVEILHQSLASEGTKDGKEVHMYPWMSKVTLDIICLTAFGYESNSLQNPENELALAYEDLISLQSGRNLARFIFVLSIPGAPAFVRTEFAWKIRWLINKIPFLRPMVILMGSMRRIRAVSGQLLSQKIAESAGISPEDSASKKDIMSLLVRARANEEKVKADSVLEKDAANSMSDYRMSNEEMMEQVLTFLGAGHETTASGLSWTLWLLANHQSVQDELRKEVTALIEKSPTPDSRSLKDCQLLDCVVMESLRLIPPVPMTIRKAAKSDWIDGIYVPKGTLFYIPIRVTNTWSEVWGPDAEEFKPERWLHLPEAYHPSLSLQTFIAGPHSCIGRTMAIIEMKAILAVLIAYFSVELAYEGQVAHPTAAVTMKPADDLPLKLKAVRPFSGAGFN